MNDKEYLESVITPLLNYPDEMILTRSVDELGVLLTLTVNPRDVSIMIGKRGQTANSLRQLLNVLGGKNRARINLKINQPPIGERYDYKSEAKSSEQISPKETQSILGDI